MRLGHVNRAIGLAVDLDSEKIRDVAFNCDVEACALHLLNDGVNLLLVRSCKDAVVRVQDVDRPAFEEDTLVGGALGETNRLEAMNQVLVPNSTCLFLAVDVLVQLKDVLAWAGTVDFETLWDFHVQIDFDVGLRVRLDVVDLATEPREQEDKDNEQPNGGPGSDGRIGLPIIDPFGLL